MQQHLAGALSPSEQREFFGLVKAGENDLVIQEQMREAWNRYVPHREAPEEWSDQVFREIIGDSPNGVSLLKAPWLRYAAAVLLIAGIGGYFYWNAVERSGTERQPVAVSQPPADIIKDIPPGKTGALLELADGSVVVLDSLDNGEVARQNGTAVVLNNGQLLYRPGTAEEKITYNTVSTPKGRQFHLVLPDGSRVWLNASSSITFPTAFGENNREVSITGETYFEIAQDRLRPFKVSAPRVNVDVLGTSFNINAYEDEGAVRTTLLEGSVKVTGHSASILRPGQQAQATADRLAVVNNPNLHKVMAWKNGLFNFEDAPFAEVMRQLARWYDIDVKYESGIPNIVFEGKLGRDVSFSRVLTFFSESGIRFRMEGDRTLIVQSKTGSGK